MARTSFSFLGFTQPFATLPVIQGIPQIMPKDSHPESFGIFQNRCLPVLMTLVSHQKSMMQWENSKSN